MKWYSATSQLQLLQDSFGGRSMSRGDGIQCLGKTFAHVLRLPPRRGCFRQEFDELPPLLVVVGKSCGRAVC